MKAADIPDSAIYALVAAVSPRWASRWDIQGHFPQMPEKVVMAKLRQMVRKGRLNGCGCGCRGDFTIPPPTFRK